MNRLFVGLTDHLWYERLRARMPLEDVNFWRPSSKSFKALREGELFLFKLHAPRDVIVGGGVFSHAARLPLGMVWDVFGVANGTESPDELQEAINRYRRGHADSDENITCIVLSEPFFFHDPIPAPAGFPNNIPGKTYHVESPEGYALLQEVRLRLAARNLQTYGAAVSNLVAARYGTPRLVPPRRGQQSFRVIVTEAYQRRCAITGERTLPVLEAAHIVPFGKGGEHSAKNGVLLRSDLHRLFDRGYLGIHPQDRRLLVSSAIRAEFENGHDYYALQGRPLREATAGQTIDSENLAFHYQHIFRGA